MRRCAEAVPHGFVHALRGTLAHGPYDAPFRTGRPRPEWLILARWGRQGEFLSVSFTGIAAPPQGEAPPDLQPRESFLGIALGGPAGGGRGFLLLRHLPPGLPVAGTFLPTDGYARLVGGGARLGLVAAGRHAHLRGSRDGQALRGDVPAPPEGAEGALAWSIVARRRTWIGDVAGQPGAAPRPLRPVPPPAVPR